VGVLAIYIGIKQFNMAIDRADAQIEFTKLETHDRQLQTRPNLVVEPQLVNDVDSIGFYIDIKNTGIRAPDSLVVRTTTLDFIGLETYKSEYYHSTSQQIEYNLNDHIIADFQIEGAFVKTQRGEYTLEIDTKYHDPVLNLWSYDTDYYYVKADMKLRKVDDLTPYKKSKLKKLFEERY
jgi:hypothetical protein